MLSRKQIEILSRITHLFCVAALLASLVTRVAFPAGPANAAANLNFILSGPFSPNAVNTIDIRTIVMADFNLDGNNDLATSNTGINTVSVWLGNGDGTIGPATVVATGGFNHWGLAAGDLNLDGNHDLVVVGSTLNKQIGVLLGNGNGTFATLQTFSTGSNQSKGSVLADFNEDGKLDVAVANAVSTSLPGTVSVLIGNGDGTFQAFTSFPTGGLDPYNLAVGDFNGDQHLDIASSNHGSGTIGVILGDGNGSFGPPATYPAGGAAPTAVATGDIDNDGVLDLATVQESGSIHTLEILPGNGDGTFAVLPTISFSGLTYPKSIVVADLDLDGNADLAVGIGYTPDLLVFKGNGDLTFTGPTSFPIGGVAPNWSSLVVGNMNGDPVPDIAVANFNANHISVLLNAAPVIYATVSPTPSGWMNTPVTVAFSCSALLGVSSLTPATTTLMEGANQTVTGICTDTSGNTASKTVTGINIDLTGPAMSYSAMSGSNPYTPGTWANGLVTVWFSCTDGLSGVDSFSEPIPLSGEGGGRSVTGTCSDKAGNTTSLTVNEINIDLGAPSISASTNPPSNGSGWNNTDVTVSFACNDTLSGLGADSPPANTTLTSEGAGQSVTGTCYDLAGNSASAAVNGINIDKTTPILNPTVSPSTIPLNGSGTVTANASDSLSGLASQSCGALDTSTAGTKTVSCTATDNAGNTASASGSYTVTSGNGFTFTGFFQPVDNPPTINQVNAGRGIPVIFSLGGDQGLNIFPAGYPTSQLISCSSGVPVDNIETTVTTGSSSLFYDPLTDKYTYVWKTEKAWSGTCRQFTIQLTDGSEHSALFKLK